MIDERRTEDTAFRISGELHGDTELRQQAPEMPFRCGVAETELHDLSGALPFVVALVFSAIEGTKKYLFLNRCMKILLLYSPSASLACRRVQTIETDFCTTATAFENHLNTKAFHRCLKLVDSREMIFHHISHQRFNLT